MFAHPSCIRREPKCLIDRYTKQHGRKNSKKNRISFSARLALLKKRLSWFWSNLNFHLSRRTMRRMLTFFNIQNSMKTSKIKALVSCVMIHQCSRLHRVSSKYRNRVEKCVQNVRLFSGDSSCLAFVQLNDFNRKTL